VSEVSSGEAASKALVNTAEMRLSDEPRQIKWTSSTSSHEPTTRRLAECSTEAEASRVVDDDQDGASARPSASIAWIVRRPAPATPLETQWCSINRGVPVSGQVRSRLRTQSQDRVWSGSVRQAGQSVAMASGAKTYAVRAKADHRGGPYIEFASRHLDFDRS